MSLSVGDSQTKYLTSLGLHRDGEKFGLSPYNTEMRRRLWWQICVLDVRASEDHGSDPSIFDHTFDTKFPLSINDEDLDPDAKEPPQPREGVSDMTFVLVRFEICALSKRLQYNAPGRGPFSSGNPTKLTLEEKEELIKETESRLEENYLKYCENAGPLCVSKIFYSCFILFIQSYKENAISYTSRIPVYSHCTAYLLIFETVVGSGDSGTSHIRKDVVDNLPPINPTG